jgi:hypothetical protein
MLLLESYSKSFALSRILPILSRDVGRNLVVPTLDIQERDPTRLREDSTAISEISGASSHWRTLDKFDNTTLKRIEV